MKTSDLVRQFGVSDTTIRRWTTEFSDYLSDEATKKDHRNRSYTSADFLVLATIRELSKEGLGLNSIREKLDSGYRVDEPTPNVVGYQDGRLVPAAVVEQIIDATEIRIELEQVKADRDRLLRMLEDAQQELKNAREKEETAKQKVESLQERIQELQREVGRMEGQERVISLLESELSETKKSIEKLESRLNKGWFK